MTGQRAGETSTTQPAPRRRRGTYANGERTKAALVDAAFELFATKGYQRLSIRQIAEEIGTSHTVLLHHFGSKDALLKAVLARRDEKEGPERGELLSTVGLLDAVPEIMRRNAQQPGVIQLDTTLAVEATNPDHAAHDFFRAREAEFLASVRSELEAERDEGRLRDGLDLDVLAHLITAQIEGAQLAWIADRSNDMSAQLTMLMGLIRHP